MNETLTSPKATPRISVIVQAADPLSRLGAVCELRRHAELDVAVEARGHAGAVVVLLAESVDECMLAHLRQLCSVNGSRIVLVVPTFPPAWLPCVLEYGVEVILRREEVCGQRLLQAVQAAARGDLQLPPTLWRYLHTWIGPVGRNGTHAITATTAGLTPREIDVIRLVAEGLDTGAIATRLSYSERTIKKILFDAKNRLGLRNRAHAVAYAFRNGYM